jgi:tetratricopeptide (TPR) repeat protein
VAKKLSSAEQAIVSAMDAGQFAHAAELATTLLASDGDNLRILLDIGHANRQLLRFDEAKKSLLRAVDLCDEDKRDVIFGELGQLERTQGDFVAAADWFNKQIETDPDDATGYLMLGSMRLQQGLPTDAIEILSRGLSCSLGCLEEVHFTIGLCHRALGKYLDAAEHFQKTLDLDQGNANAKIALKDVKSAQSALASS